MKLRHEDAKLPPGKMVINLAAAIVEGEPKVFVSVLPKGTHEFGMPADDALKVAAEFIRQAAKAEAMAKADRERIAEASAAKRAKKTRWKP